MFSVLYNVTVVDEAAGEAEIEFVILSSERQRKASQYKTAGQETLISPQESQQQP